MSDTEKMRKIANLLIKTNEDIKWDIENLINDEIWVSAFIEGAIFMRDIYSKAIDKITPEEVKI